jgi:hypothetical protein
MHQCTQEQDIILRLQLNQDPYKQHISFYMILHKEWSSDQPITSVWWFSSGYVHVHIYPSTAVMQ